MNLILEPRGDVVNRCRSMRDDSSGQWMTSKRGAALLVVMLAVSCGQAIVGASFASASTSVPTIDLAAPTATVHDPVATLAAVDTECAPGQVDLNTASESELSATLDLPSRPTVDRLVALRPWLKGSDLSSVPGIGPNVAAALAPKTCATQLVLPAASPLACTSDAQVDLQAAPASVMTSTLKLPEVTANAIVAARPLPQNLMQVITPRVQGLSQPRVTELLNDNGICVTPAPMLAAGAAWRWATPKGGALVRRSGFGLIVPPGRIEVPVGTYISVKPLEPSSEFGLPRMDAKIHGAWATGTTSVAVEGPWDGTDNERPAVFHDSSDGLTLSIGQGTAVSNVAGKPTVTALVFSLTEISIGTSTCEIASAPLRIDPVLCRSSLSDALVRDAWQAEATDAGYASAASVSPNPFCATLKTPISTATASGGLPLGLGCTTFSHDVVPLVGTGNWAITNNAYTEAGGLGTAGVVYFDYVTHSGGGTDTLVGSVKGNRIIAYLLDKLRIDGALLPGQSVIVSKPPSFLSTDVHAEVSKASSVSWGGIEVLAESLAGMAGDYVAVLYSLIESGESCLGLPLNQFDQVVSCGKALIEQAIKTQKALTADSRRKAKLGSILKVFSAISAGQVSASFNAAFISQLYSGDNKDLYLHNEPDRPRVDASGRGVFIACLDRDDYAWIIKEACQNERYAAGDASTRRVPAGDSYIARDPKTQEAVLVKPNGTVWNIKDGGTFNCLAATWFVFDNPALSAHSKPIAGDASCANAGARRWNFRPERDGGNIPNSVILRERPEDATNGVIASYLINNRGEIQTITGPRSGGIYLCLAQTNPVIWNVPYGNVPFVGIAQWRPVGTEDASCGSG